MIFVSRFFFCFVGVIIPRRYYIAVNIITDCIYILSRFKPLPDVDRLRDRLDYDKENGCLIWKKTSERLGRFKGQPAARSNWWGYRTIHLDGDQYMEHRLIWLWNKGEDPGDMQVDHRDRNNSNNRIENLRLGDYQDNLRNTASVGVGWHTSARKWRAYICVDRKDIHLGLFVELEDAVKARLQAEIHYFGEWAPTCYEDFDEELKARMERLTDLKRSLKSKSKGVSFDSQGKRWTAYLYYQRKHHWLGSFRTKTEALYARRQAEIRFGLASEVEPALASRYARLLKSSASSRILN